MSEEFWKAVKAAVRQWGRHFDLDEDGQQTALVLAWWQQRKCPRTYAPTTWAAWGIRRAVAGRDLPGIQRKGNRCPHLRGRALQGGGMGEVRDVRPGPDHCAAFAEHRQAFLARLTGKRKQLVELGMAEGNPRTDRAASLFGVTPARLSQIRRELAELWAECG